MRMIAKIRGYLLVVGFFFGDMIALVMRFLAVDQMMLKSKRIIWLDCGFVFRPASTKITIDVGHVMVDDHNHSANLMCLRGFSKNASLL